ncbi:hypothetical protein TSUD_161910 [Trifolium subterraneum]|uniref:Uncharacterized protein n=1 Tax=Trifolium subterraneum TaxID=3900 RepID=A0A2Z6MB25_TRISU|nr:hypothetical protein TSUD_161910 [Trifolium subterraneum]
MDLSNSKNLGMTPSFEGIQNLERLDLTGCINLSQVDPSIGLLTKLVFLSLQNCSSLVRLDFNGVSSLSSLIVLRLSGCTKLENPPDFTRAFNLEYLDMDQCTSLSTIHESIGALVAEHLFPCKEELHKDVIEDIQFEWVQRLVQEPRHFRCGFDIVLPWHWTNMDCREYPIPTIPHWFDHRFNGGAQIKFKARQNLIMKECGLRLITKEDIEASEWKPRTDPHLKFYKMEETSSSSSFEPKIELPYNWLVSVDECVENDTAKGKEIDLFNLGLLTGRPQ